MPDLPARKAGIIACSGEEIAEGTVTRLAALKVLQQLRPRDTVTLCLPLFIAGGEGDRAFARSHPTIAVDGCALRCAARATEMYSGKPAASIVVSDLVAEFGLEKPHGCRRLNGAGQQAVETTAQRLAELVDQVLEKKKAPAASDAVSEVQEEPVQATCSCGSGIPAAKLSIEGQVIEIVALPLILEQFRRAGRVPDDATAGELMEAVKVYNSVPPQLEAAYRQAIQNAYAAWSGQERSQ